MVDKLDKVSTRKIMKRLVEDGNSSGATQQTDVPEVLTPPLDAHGLFLTSRHATRRGDRRTWRARPRKALKFQQHPCVVTACPQCKVFHCPSKAEPHIEGSQASRFDICSFDHTTEDVPSLRNGRKRFLEGLVKHLRTPTTGTDIRQAMAEACQ